MNRDGFALITALWLIVALSVLALEFGLESRDRRLVAINRVEAVRARSVAEAGLEHSRVELERRLAESARLLSAASADRDPWARVEQEDPIEGNVGTARYAVRAVDLGGRLNINRADGATIRRLLTAVGLDAGRSDRLAETILDWRDPDDFRRARGAEGVDYLEAGAAFLPANGPFRSVEELRWVEGMTERDFERLKPLVTVRGSGRVNLSSAPAPVLLSLPGMHGEVLEIILERRAYGLPIPSLTELALTASPHIRDALERSLPELVSRTTPDTRELLLIAEGWPEGGTTSKSLEAILVRSAGSVFLSERRAP
jgi:general secretion pathway protein K